MKQKIQLPAFFFNVKDMENGRPTTLPDITRVDALLRPLAWETCYSYLSLMNTVVPALYIDRKTLLWTTMTT